MVACGPAPRVGDAKGDPTTDRAYVSAVAELKELNRGARECFRKGDKDTAAAIIQRGETISKTLMAVSRPSLAATVEASDLDQLYGDMLFSNRNYGWARLFYQKNRARWKFIQPQTADTAQRLKQAEDAMAECDRRITDR